ncbi:MAG: DUF3352 domain-containing protein [Leptolyngbyaceae cyanobacterium SL_7_1]|nr:DUF3352 domain-containing protein [Leptolyngbyaceae cyanobacterium SL_7_1]
MALKRKSLLFGALGAIAGIGLGGAVAAVWLSQQRSMQAGAPFGADLIPQSALATITLTTDEEQWQALQRFGTAETRAIATKTLTQWRDQFLTVNGLNYQQDIQPWIGETVTVAMVSIVPIGQGKRQRNRCRWEWSSRVWWRCCRSPMPPPPKPVLSLPMPRLNPPIGTTRAFRLEQSSRNKPRLPLLYWVGRSPCRRMNGRSSR